MAWKFNNESPIYLQIVDAIKMQIADGRAICSRAKDRRNEHARGAESEAYTGVCG